MTQRVYLNAVFVIARGTVPMEVMNCQLSVSCCWALGPQDETWTDFDGPSWIQYDLFRKKTTTGSKKKKSGQVYASSGIGQCPQNEKMKNRTRQLLIDSIDQTSI